MQQTQTAVQQRKRNLQDYLLSKLRRSRMGATVFLVNGFQIRGEIRGFDSFVVVIYSDGKQQMVYKHAISTVVPERPLSWEEEDPGPPMCLFNDLPVSRRRRTRREGAGR